MRGDELVEALAQLLLERRLEERAPAEEGAGKTERHLRPLPEIERVGVLDDLAVLDLEQCAEPCASSAFTFSNHRSLGSALRSPSIAHIAIARLPFSRGKTGSENSTSGA
jgi:hypothetical protein